MSNKIKLFALLTLVVASIGVAHADGHLTTAYVVHGIPGQDLMQDPALPVDVAVSGLGCPLPLQGFSFGDRVGPLEIPAGEYDITISLADDKALSQRASPYRTIGSPGCIAVPGDYNRVSVD